MGKRVTIYDVAKAAGVSAATVSRTLTRPGRVGPETAQAVLRVARELGYRVDEETPALRKAATHTIGLTVSDLTNPYFFPIIKGAHRAAGRAGVSMMLGDVQESGVIERQLLSRAGALVDGLVVGSSRVPDQALLAAARMVPVVILNRQVSGLRSVVPDADRGMREAVAHLAALGHTRLVHACGPRESWPAADRWRALHRAAAAAGVRVTRTAAGRPTMAGGAALAEEILASHATAVVAYNDLMAIGLMREFQRRGVHIPRQISIVGFDDIFAADLVYPPLTTISAPLERMGEMAVANLLDRGDEGGSHPAECVVVATRLILRESTGTAPS